MDSVRFKHLLGRMQKALGKEVRRAGYSPDRLSCLFDEDEQAFYMILDTKRDERGLN